MTGIFTLDSIIAIVVAVGMITAIVFLVSQPKVSSDEYLYKVTLDILTIAEKRGDLSKAVRGDPWAIQDFKGVLPRSVCFQLDIYNETNGLVLHDDTKCEKPNKYMLGKRSFVSDKKFYVANLKMWYK